MMLAAAALMALTASARERKCFDADWRFMLADSAVMATPEYNDAHWRQLDLPHDWAIEGDFSASNPSGAGGGALPGGVGWYRKRFSLTAGSERFFLEFDGVYMNSTVYVNGQEMGFRPYGYSSFEYDITPYVHEGENVVAVRVDNSDQPNSRWYSGCGIYRHVWLTRTNAVHVKHWGVHVQTTPKGEVKVDVDVEGQGYKVRNTVFDADGREVGLRVKKPRLWSPDAPNIYNVRTQVLVGGQVVDEVWTTTAFRDFRFDAQTGFWLNGQNMKINGVCEHHDFGCLGAALHEDALHRKLTKLKAMGVNAIRSSHNPPAPELLAMCDTMGFIVMDESFDMWRRRKTQNDYARFFDEWHERDLTDLVLRDRNHPCILMWSIGNEVLEQWSSAEADTLSLEQANLILNMPHEEPPQAPLSSTEGDTIVPSDSKAIEAPSGAVGGASEYHVWWRVQFEPGEIRAVSRKDGQTVCEQTIRTAGQPHHIRLTVDYAGRDLTFVNAEVVDRDGNLCPWAEDQIFFTTADGAQVIATDNGCQTSMERLRVGASAGSSAPLHRRPRVLMVRLRVQIRFGRPKYANRQGCKPLPVIFSPLRGFCLYSGLTGVTSEPPSEELSIEIS